jgi:Kef-type K+ transport system membrane component KefB
LVKLPLSIMLFASNIMLFLANRFGIPPLIIPGLVKKYYYNWVVSSQKAVEKLGYEITPFETGLQKTLDWLNKEK